MIVPPNQKQENDDNLMDESEEYDDEIDRMPAPRSTQAKRLDNRLYFNK